MTVIDRITDAAKDLAVRVMDAWFATPETLAVIREAEETMDGLRRETREGR